MRGKSLLLEERELTLRGIREKLTDRATARRIGRNQSVITREIANNGGRDRYSPGGELKAELTLALRTGRPGRARRSARREIEEAAS